jgi:formylglycine-generating enzyme required for sulfatase activity
MSFTPNPFGLYDMGGNVSEWVGDCWHDNYIRAPRTAESWVNPGCSRRVIRGGSWGSAPDMVRSAYRQGADADLRSARVGFRVVREL